MTYNSSNFVNYCKYGGKMQATACYAQSVNDVVPAKAGTTV